MASAYSCAPGIAVGPMPGTLTPRSTYAYKLLILRLWFPHHPRPRRLHSRSRRCRSEEAFPPHLHPSFPHTPEQGQGTGPVAAWVYGCGAHSMQSW
eukprot:scaffold125785_cov26-Tisochrysis_lutea.AAC.1